MPRHIINVGENICAQRRMGVSVFAFDTAPPHPGVQIAADGVATRDTNGGWVTLRSSQSLSHGCSHWAIQIIDQGEGNDGSGLMIGLVPRLQSHAAPMLGSKYISELGGWCLSRAGEGYGTWKVDPLPFTSGSVVEFDLDIATKTLTIVCGRDTATGHIPALQDIEDLYPAISLYYMNQKVAFV
jgi:hypothetical protein